MDGDGFKWGRHNLTETDIEILLGTHGCAMIGVEDPELPEDFDLYRDAMLRDPYPWAVKAGIECVGEEFEVVEATA